MNGSGWGRRHQVFWGRKTLGERCHRVLIVPYKKETMEKHGKEKGTRLKRKNPRLRPYLKRLKERRPYVLLTSVKMHPSSLGSQVTIPTHTLRPTYHSCSLYLLRSPSPPILYSDRTGRPSSFVIF